MIRTLLPVLLAGAAALIAVGCSSQRPSPRRRPMSPKHEEHAHQSQHGGIIVSIGRDSYHAEAVFEKGGTLRLYMLGKDESKVQEVEAQAARPPTPRPTAATEAEQFVLQARAAAGRRARQDLPVRRPAARSDLPARASRSRSRTSRIGGERFRIGFKSVRRRPPTADAGMPAKLADRRGADKLFLTPGGQVHRRPTSRPTATRSPSVKFQRHPGRPTTPNPKPGDKICPITETKANPKFTWVVGGKTYEFCCPPCIDEFVATAKEKPDEIKDPEFYRKK